MDSVEFAELLCARLCHDLSGAVGAAAAGAELFEDVDGPLDRETLALVAESAASAASRLKFFRATFGPAASTPQSSTALRSLMSSYFGTQVSASSPGLLLVWEDAPLTLDGITARLVLNLALLAKDSLPRGGRISLETPPDGSIRAVAYGEPASLSDEARAVLIDGLHPPGPRGAQAAFTRLLAGREGRILTVTVTPAGLALSLGSKSSPSSVGD